MRRHFLLFAIFIFTTIGLSPHTIFAQSDSVTVGQEVNNTPTPTPTTVGGGGSGGGGTTDVSPPQISNVKITVSNNAATITWTTDEPSSSHVAWGKNQDYRDGVSVTQKFTTNHLVEINSLQERLTYFFLITAFDPSGNQSSYSGQFITLSAPDTTPPANVTQLQATPREDSIVLTWKNPPDEDFAYVRVVSSTQFFPLDPYNGKVVYEGNGQQAIDPVAGGVVYYYTVFSRDRSGNYSSGAITFAKVRFYSEPGSNPKVTPGQPGYGGKPPTDGPLIDLNFIHSGDLPSLLLTGQDFLFTTDICRAPA